MLSFIESRKLLGCDRGPRWIPADGIMRARIKPAARRLWREAGIDMARYTVIDDRNASQCLAEAELSLDATYYVKPVGGMGSEQVRRARGAGEVQEAIDATRVHFGRLGLLDTRVQVDGLSYAPFAGSSNHSPVSSLRSNHHKNGAFP